MEPVFILVEWWCKGLVWRGLCHRGPAYHPMDFLCGQVSLDVQKKTTKNLSFCIHFHVWICVFICLYDFVHVGVLSFGHARLVF